jgi:hypothetical protein
MIDLTKIYTTDYQRYNLTLVRMLIQFAINSFVIDVKQLKSLYHERIYNHSNFDIIFWGNFL